MNLSKLQELEISKKRVILRADLDVKNLDDGENKRLKNLIPTLEYLAEKQAKTVIIGHKGRPEGRASGEFSLKSIADKLRKISGKNISFVDDIVGKKAKKAIDNLKSGEFLMLENLRFDKREEENDVGFAKELATFGEIYINEAFAVSHREHSSIVGLPKLLPFALGLYFQKEIDNLGKIFKNPKKPVVFVISGIKQDKIDYFQKLEKLADKILVAGRLPEYIHDTSPFRKNERYVIGGLMPDREDITINSVENFEKEIGKAGTIIVSGPMGKYEDEGHKMGTARILTAISKSDAYKIAGGGNTEAAISVLNLDEKFDWISTGGGAMLEFISSGTLPGLIALSKDDN